MAKQNEDYQWVWTQDDECRNESSFRRDAETNTRDACATQVKSRATSPKSSSGRMRYFTNQLSFSNLGLAVIDEQHKFGVAQRARLTTGEPAPDVLVMTATPIPRTLTMTIYGDLEVSTIDEMPTEPGRNHHCVSRYVEVGRSAQLFENGIGEGPPALRHLSVDR